MFNNVTEVNVSMALPEISENIAEAVELCKRTLLQRLDDRFPCVAVGAEEQERQKTLQNIYFIIYEGDYMVLYLLLLRDVHQI